MKKFLISTLAVLTVAGPLIASPASADPPRWHRDGDWRGDHDRDDADGWRAREGHSHWRDRDGDRGDWRRDRDDDDGDRDDRWDRRHARWDDRRHNGYSYNGRWYYGPPPSAYYRDRVDYGYRSWRRGDRLPRYYLDRYRDVDYRDYDLGPPPRGCRYVRDDRGDVLLVGIATGVIFSAMLSDRY